MFRLAAEPKRWMRVTAPVSAEARFRPACLSRNPAMTRWTIRSTADTILGPAYVAFGQALSGQRPNSFYLILGTP